MRKPLRTFAGLAGMDLSSRTAYQMGKSPVLPLFALSLGAGAEMVGLVVGISTVAGILLKPMMGRLSDRFGRRPLLLLGAALFVLVPSFYLMIDSVPGLLALRLSHGVATAIYGPVMAALVVDLFSQPQQGLKAFGWYDFFRSGGYVIGPLLGGLALSRWGDPAIVYLCSAVIALPALIPALLLPADSPRVVEPTPLLVQRSWLPGPGVRLPVALEVCARVLSRMTVVFWPLAVVESVSPALMGIVLAALATGSLLCKPLFGFLATRFGVIRLALVGALFMVLGAPALFAAHSIVFQVLAAVAIGIGEGLISPAVMGLVAYAAPVQHRGETMGRLGAWRNSGKAAGPILCGFIVSLTGPLVAASLCALPLAFTAVKLARVCEPTQATPVTAAGG